MGPQWGWRCLSRRFPCLLTGTIIIPPAGWGGHGNIAETHLQLLFRTCSILSCFTEELMPGKIYTGDYVGSSSQRGEAVFIQHISSAPGRYSHSMLGLLLPELLVSFCGTAGLWGSWMQPARLRDVLSVLARGMTRIPDSYPAQTSEGKKQQWAAAVGLLSPPRTIPAFLSPCLSTNFPPDTLSSQLCASISIHPTSSGERVWPWFSPSCNKKAKSWLQTCLCPGKPRPGEVRGEHLAHLGHGGLAAASLAAGHTRLLALAPSTVGGRDVTGKASSPSSLPGSCFCDLP